jgi:hypothetical protein
VTPLLEQVAEAPLEITPLRGLDDQPSGMESAGAALSRASEIRPPTGSSVSSRSCGSLPPELRRSLDVDR